MTPCFILSAALLAPAQIANTDLVEQLARAERSRNLCGPVAACYCLQAHGKRVQLEDVLSQVGPIGTNGVSVSALVQTLQGYGLSAQTKTLDADSIVNLQKYSILILKTDHCIVFLGLDQQNNLVRVFEPAANKEGVVTMNELHRLWAGEVIEIRSAPTLLAQFGWAGLGFCTVVAACRLVSRARVKRASAK